MNTIVVVGCGIGWGLLAAVPLVGRLRRDAVVARLRVMAPRGVPRRVLPWDSGPVGSVARGVLRARRQRRIDVQLERDLPAVFDLLGVAVGAGSTPRGALETAMRWGPTVIAVHLRQVVMGTELGASLTDALHDLAEQCRALAPVADVLIASARLGAPAGPALARLGDETRSALRRQAEARARTLPVKLLFPLCSWSSRRSGC